MLRATVWTLGLFGAGTAISRVLPGTWTEPLVLFALGLALLFVSARTARESPKSEDAVPNMAKVPQPAAQVTTAAAVAAAAVAASASVQVERTA
jgi:hypothetical protein